MNRLEMPDRLAGLHVHRDNRLREQVVSDRRAALEAPRRAYARQVPHEQSEIDAADLDEQPFQDVGMPAQMHTARPAGLVEMRVGPFQPFAPLPQQLSRVRRGSAAGWHTPRPARRQSRRDRPMDHAGGMENAHQTLTAEGTGVEARFPHRLGRHRTPPTRSTGKTLYSSNTTSRVGFVHPLRNRWEGTRRETSLRSDECSRLPGSVFTIPGFGVQLHRNAQIASKDGTC